MNLMNGNKKAVLARWVSLLHIIWLNMMHFTKFNKKDKVYFFCVCNYLYPRKNISHIILCNFSLFLHFVLFCAFQPIYVYVVCITTILTLFFVRIILSISSYMFLKYVLKCFLRRWEYKFCTRSDNIHLKEISIEKGYFNGGCGWHTKIHCQMVEDHFEDNGFL